ncbi:hypothetical protein ACHAXA_011917 [Cyclostephanos tholiformis]|uniref:Uncharacterized protein n=1 Tax=Cyclostephanos tholiformis TaxID=382380 RepID=A0ABD3SC91_9STRA
MRTPQRYGYYHNVLVRARKKHSCLYGLMLKTGRQSSVYNDLTKLLSECRQVFADLEKVVDTAKKRQEKKDDVKRFKSYIARILEADDPAAWMKDVTSEELLCEGGDVNRLYQLFTESKRRQTPKADLLVFDSEMYEEASLREDLFSAKQRKDLSAKGNEVAALDAKEEEEVAAAEEKRKSEEEEREKLRKEADSCDKWAMVGHNATIHGLTSKKGKTLNNQPARIIFFVVEKDRFEVELYNSDEKILLKKENLNLYYGHFSFDDALLPRGLMDISVTTPATSLPLEVPSEIGIRSQGFMIRDTITVTDDGERSSTSKTSSSFTLNENDPLLVFLRSQHLCVKGSVDEFYTWLVKSEDIDSIAALKEAVSDDEYLENSMKIGCGTSGLKGFKRRAFQRATLEYHEEQAGILSTKHNDSSPLRGFDNPLVPANLAANFFF